MYTNHFGLSDNPFRMTPDPRFLYLTPNHREALSSLVYGVLARKGFMLLTGDAGTGKTTLIHALLNMLHHKKAACAFVFHPVLAPEEFLDYVLADLGITGGDRHKGGMLRSLHAFLLKQHEADATTALIIDEAHKLPPVLLEEIRLFSNLETSRDKLFQIVLAGQNELEELFRRDDMRQFKQRITLRSRLEPLTLEQTAEYIHRRVAGCGRVAADIFAPDVFPAIHSLSGGIPRLVNNLCDNALLSAFAQNARIVTRPILREVAADLDLHEELNAAGGPLPESQGNGSRPAPADETAAQATLQAIGAPQSLKFLEHYGERTKTMSILTQWAEKFRLTGNRPVREGKL